MLEWGSRGREFESRHSDQYKNRSKERFFFYVINLRVIFYFTNVKNVVLLIHLKKEGEKI